MELFSAHANVCLSLGIELSLLHYGSMASVLNIEDLRGFKEKLLNPAT